MISSSIARPYRVNLGCGSRFDPSWVNIDIASTGVGVIAHDVSRGIPLPDGSAELVYHSHVLEHIPRENAPQFLRECFRILQPGGILRVAVPDLERIARTYLEKLEQASKGDRSAAFDYQWIMLELFDQAVRNKSGGGMLDYIAAPELHNAGFIVKRIGEEGKGLIRGLREGNQAAVPRRPLSARLRNLPRRAAGLYRKVIARILLGKTGSTIFSVGSMRLSGEVHQWMYDRYSLAELMRTAGFENPVQKTAAESALPGWSRLNLDTDDEGAALKPDSLYMEAIRPRGG